MKWHHQTDYHGSREYASDDAECTAVDRLTTGLSFLLEVVRRRIGKLLKRVEPQRPTTILKMGDRRGFTILGLPGLTTDEPHDAAAPWPAPSRVQQRARFHSERDLLSGQ